MNELEDMPRKRVNEKDGTNYLKSVGQLQKVQPNCNGNPGEGRGLRKKEYVKRQWLKVFQINDRHQTTSPGNLENAT